MTDSFHVLAQISPSLGSLTPAYTVPVSTTATISSISICNTTATPATFRISIQIGGTGDNIKQYLYYDLPLLNNDTFIATVGLTLGTGDIIAVQTNANNIAFNIFGVEIT